MTDSTASDGNDVVTGSSAIPATTDTSEGTAPARRGGSRSQLLAGVAILVIGIAVCVFGRLAASNASDDLVKANRSLRGQQQATHQAQGCEATLRSDLGAVVPAAQALLGTANGIVDQAAVIVAAQHDAQPAGAQNRISDYNNAIDRGNAAADAANHARDVARTQSTTLQQKVAALPPACS